MKNEIQDKKENLNSNLNNEIKYFYTIEDFPKFKILEKNYKKILDELLSVITKENQINFKEKDKLEKIKFDSYQLHAKEASDNDKQVHINNLISNSKNNPQNPQNISMIDRETKEINLENNFNFNNNFNDNNIHNIPNKTKNLNNFNSSSYEQNDADLNQYKNIGVNLNENSNELEKTLSLNSDIRTFEPWIEKNLYQESNEEGWDVAPLMIGGVKIPERWGKFPFLASLVSQISGVVSVSFSLLKPGTHIVPHKGYDDYSEKMYRYHMGMLVPEGDIGIRVEKEIRKWENAKSFVFDDFMIHEAWNFTPKNRIVLIIDFLKDENKIPEGIKFFDANFNKSVKGYLKKESSEDKENNEDNSDFGSCEEGADDIEHN
jgi:ornithine lipid ester-linked acyl 2-hydroxylase